MDGLERSGNVYLSHVLTVSFGTEVKSARTHLVKTLIEYKGSDPFIVPLRDQLDSITSSKLFADYIFNNNLFNNNNNNGTKIEIIIKRHERYVDYLIENPKFFIAPFHEFTKDHNTVIDKIIKFYPDCKSLKNRKIKTKEEILLNIQEKDFKDSHHPELGNFPRTESQQKQVIRSLLLNKYSKEISRIQEKNNILYQRYYNI
jgi:hypothetical protein